MSNRITDKDVEGAVICLAAELAIGVVAHGKFAERCGYCGVPVAKLVEGKPDRIAITMGSSCYGTSVMLMKPGSSGEFELLQNGSYPTKREAHDALRAAARGLCLARRLAEEAKP